ncbi:MAG TPA: tetratricopeptide repeat protein [Pyrinomonadaceae bacterium]|jgi:Tetratricopeptide repeat|nr:tetratricopeptide repeat protein [Pyrinomonadaceae bacterium]
MPQEIVHVNVRNPLIKVLLILLLIAAGVWSYFVVRWYIGNTLAEYFNPGENSLETARMAASLAPNDPLTHWRMAQVSQKTLPLDQQTQAIAEFEKAVTLSPNDYRYWMSLGTAQEQAGDTAKGESALRRAVALAPAYAYPHWFLGNLLLRNGRYDEAFAELRVASEANSELRPQQFHLIWEIYSSDPEALKNAVGPSAGARASFALYLLDQKHYDEGLRLWNGLSADEKIANKETGDEIIKTLRRDLRFHDALNVWNDLSGDKYHLEIGRVFDGSFEEPISYGPELVFGWQSKSALQMQIGIDPTKSHSGARSLKLLFQVRANIDAINVSQLVAVLPNSEYDFECYVSTEKLETGSAPQVQVLDASSGAELASSAMAPGGTNDWSRIGLSFKTSEKTEAVILKIVRVSCSNEEDTPTCPIFGSVWYDDFSIKRRN